MPVTPFHFGPGAALHALAPKHVSFIAFCAANVLVDVEPLYYMVTGQYPLHRFFHTYIGVSLVVACTTAILMGLLALSRRIPLPDLFQWKALTPRQTVIGAALGGYSHIVFDSIMHQDIRPFAPFSEGNPLLRAVSLETLHWSCLDAGVLGLAILAIRRRLREKPS